MILLLDTSTPLCRIGIVQGDALAWHEWEANRELAKGLLGYLKEILTQHEGEFSNLQGIGVYKGPGSFTGLRIGLTVMNTLADSLAVPIVGASGDEWIDSALTMLSGGENHRIVLPDYGAEAHITKPRK